MTILTFGLIVMLQSAPEDDVREDADVVRELRRLGAELFFEKKNGRIKIDCIALDHKNFDEEELGRLGSALKNVTAKSFQVNAGTMTGDLLRAVSRIRGLEDVMLLSVTIENQHLKWLTSSPTLKRLTISACDLSALSAIEHNRALLELSVAYSEINDTGVTGLSRVAALEKLDLSGNKITDRSIGEIVKCVNLKYLDLNNTRVTPAGIEKLVALRQLEEIDLGWTRLDDASFQKLASIQSLKRIHVYRTDVSDIAINRVRSKVPKLDIVTRP